MPQYFHRKRVPTKGKERVEFDALNKVKQNRVKEEYTAALSGQDKSYFSLLGRRKDLSVLEIWIIG
jgi:hypothetical protein